MDSSPLRAIVLDNDEASGSYIIIFDLWETLMKTSLGDALEFTQVLDFLIKNVMKYNIFRPGLMKFLTTCVELRDTDRIDAIIMYTHQNADYTWKEWSVPALLATLMGHLVARKHPGGKLKRRLFDYVLTLPPDEFQREVNGWVVKDFERILNLYPWKPKDIRKILFVDDHASPKYIEAETIAPDKKHTSSWYKVSPYRIAYGANLYRQIVAELCEEYGLEVSEEDSAAIDEIAHGTRVDRGGPSTYYPEDSTFRDLDSHVREIYKAKK
jgi:hypothetical protein